jgi:hypothetical protein
MANSVLSYSTVGATSLFTTVEDEMKWLNNYETAEVGGQKAIDQMYEQAVLNNGQKIGYAFALNIDDHNGYKQIGHGGADAGYRTFAVRYPEEKLGVVVFSNLGSFQPWEKAGKIADIFLPEKKSEAKKDSIIGIELDPTIFAAYAGTYAFDEGRTCTVYVDSGKYYAKFWGPEVITPINDSTFGFWDGYAKIVFSKRVNGKAQAFTLQMPNESNTYKRYDAVTLSAADRAKYVGVYESEELDTRYEVVIVNDQLVLRHNKYKDVVLTATVPGMFSCPHWWMENLIFSHDPKGTVNGFEVNSGRVLHLKFRKRI